MNRQPLSPSGLAPVKMQVATVFTPERGVRTHLVSGVVNVPEFREILLGIYSASQFDPDLNALWDLRPADFSAITPLDVRTLMHVVMGHWGRGGTGRSAIVVAGSLEYGVARVYVSQFGLATSRRIKIVLTPDEAWRWLGETPLPVPTGSGAK